MQTNRRLTGIDIAFSLRDSAHHNSRPRGRVAKLFLGMRLLLANMWRNRRELSEITGWDTVRVWRYSTSMLATKHNVSFIDDGRFQKAYQVATKAAKRDHWNAGMHFRIHQALWAADHGLRIGGNLVELGTGRGIIFSAILSATPDWEIRENQVFLFDTFSSAAMDKGTGFQDQRLGTSPVYAQSYEDTKLTFAAWSRVHLIRGLLPDSLEEVNVGDIGFLHVDLNSHVVEAVCLEKLWPNLIPGAVVLLDDYAHVNSEAQYDAMNACAARLGVSILTLASGQGILVKYS